MRYLFMATILLISFSCSKKADKIETTDIETCYFAHPWLSGKIDSLSACVCETLILSGTYKGETVFEQRLIAPLCNGFNIVYRGNGTVLLNSLDRDAYELYLVEVVNLEERWRCSKN